MINTDKLDKILQKYKYHFEHYVNKDGTYWEQERFKWQAVKRFQDCWNIEATDFASMLKDSLDKTELLLQSQSYHMRSTLESYVAAEPETVRALFRNLFDENIDIVTRFDEFKTKSRALHLRVKSADDKSFQDERAISVYLFLRYPEKYYLYRFEQACNMANALESGHKFVKGHYSDNIKGWLSLYNEVAAQLITKSDIVGLPKSHFDGDCYDDPKCHLLTSDFAFYITAYYKNYWMMSCNPKMWDVSSFPVGDTQDVTMFSQSGNKRHIYQNFLDAKVGEPLLFYESNPTKCVVAIGEIAAAQDGTKIVVRKKEALANPVPLADLKSNEDLAGMELFKVVQGTFYKLTQNEYNCLMDMIRDENPAPRIAAPKTYGEKEFLNEVFMSADKYEEIKELLLRKKNIILQGAPGVGKTFAAKRLAYSIIGNEDDSVVECVQFHQNYSYEDFVEGYKPQENGSFKNMPGIFTQFCLRARNFPQKKFFFIIDEINRGNLSKIFGELLMLIEKEYRGHEISLASNQIPFSVPENLYIIGMMNTADRSLAMIDYALRRRFSFVDMEPGFDTDGFKAYAAGKNSDTFNALVAAIQQLNQDIATDSALGKGFCIGHSYFVFDEPCTDQLLRSIVRYDILPMLREYWFDNDYEYNKREKTLKEVVHDDQ